MNTATEITNIAAYKFAPMQDLRALRERLLIFCKKLGLRGTILLSKEGINLFIAGDSDSVESLLAELRAIPGLEDLVAKYSPSRDQPFRRMLVKIKKEIIAFGIDDIEPGKTARISAQELKQWLDEGRPVTLFDTRNDYEVRLGTFKGALPAGIDHFREFPKAVERLTPQLKEHPVVMFCTGGIRCEKAGPYMEREGFTNVYQLDGGILKYFEECGNAHYDGECFVFDHRVGVDPALRETASAQCFGCQTPLTEEDQLHPHYQPPDYCPHCYDRRFPYKGTETEHLQQQLNAVAIPLPGSVEQENIRPLLVSQKHNGWTILAFLCSIFKGFGEAEWTARIAQGRIQTSEGQAVSAEHKVRAGERYHHLEPAVIEPDVNAAIQILYLDSALMVLNKPAPLPMHPSGRFHRNTLSHLLCKAFAPVHPRPAHRLDANTTGVLVCARTRSVAGVLQSRFANGNVEKQYLVAIRGTPQQDYFISEAPISTDAGKVGAHEVDYENGRSAKTEFRVLKRLEKITLLWAKPITGRTNQIRIHLWDLGYAVLGDTLYLPNHQLGKQQTLSIDAPPLQLHAWRIGFRHPETNVPVMVEAPAPAWTEPFGNVL